MNTSSTLQGNSQGKSSRLDVYAPSLSGKPLMGAPLNPSQLSTTHWAVLRRFRSYRSDSGLIGQRTEEIAAGLNMRECDVSRLLHEARQATRKRGW